MSAGETLLEGKEPPPRGTGPMALFRWALLVVTAAVAFAAFWILLGPGPKGAVKYTCPMVEHAFVVADEPGECPLCHMKLTPFDPELIEARKREAQAELADAGPGVAGLIPVALHLDRAQKIGVRSVVVEEVELHDELEAPVYVASPEQGESRVHVRAPGFVERIAVAEVGTRVVAGQPLAYVYSPEIYRAQEEFLLARRWQAGEQAGGAQDAGSQPMADAARKRLELFGLSARDIDAIVAKKSPERATPVRAPASGSVVRREVALGAYVSPEMLLYEIIDLSRLYFVADVAADASAIRPGARGVASFGGLGEVIVKVDLVYPEVNAASRTVRVRLRPDEASKLLLRPGLFGKARFSLGSRRALLVPRDAVIDTGSSTYVFLDQGDGRFSPRLVALGREQGGLREIRSGLQAGDRVVSSAAFLIDSESRLQAAFSGVGAGAGGSGPHPPPLSGNTAEGSAAGSSRAPASAAPSASPSQPRSLLPAHASPPPPTQPKPPPPSPQAPSPTQAPSPAPQPTPTPTQAQPQAQPSAPGVVQYVCPMHPHVHSSAPGRCGECGMDLEQKR